MEKLRSHFKIMTFMCIHESHRRGKQSLKPPKNQVDAPVVEISSTFIRGNIKKEKCAAFIACKVWEYIDHNNFIKNNYPKT
jgi:nicotinate-nucleotide adenylyltransferase